MGLVIFHVVVACLIALALEILGQRKLAGRLSFTHGLSMWIRGIANFSIAVVIVTVLYNLGGKANPQGLLSLRGVFSQHELFATLIGLALLVTPFAHLYGLGSLILLAAKLSDMETTAGLGFGFIGLTLAWTTLFLFAEFTALANSFMLVRFGVTVRSTTLVVFAVVALASCGLAIFDLGRLADWMATMSATKASTSHAFMAIMLLGVCWSFVALGVYVQILLPLAVIPTICLMAFSFGISPTLLVVPFSLAMLLNLTPTQAVGRIS